MMFTNRITLLYYFSIFIVEIYSNNVSSQNDKDPFRSLGIPDLNPKSLLTEVEEETTISKKPVANSSLKLKSIEDLPNFLKNSNLDEGEGIKILTRFLIQDDFTLKKYGVVYDQTGFDGIGPTERVAPVGTEERLMQRARSAANIWFKTKYAKLEYDAYGAEGLMDEIVPNWRIYKVLMIGKNGENTFIKVCVPLDESETALCSDKDELCGFRAKYVEKEKKKNEDYISKIRSNNFFKRKPGMGKIKLLPGEKIIVKDNNKKIVLDSNTMNNNNGGFYNPPSVESVSRNDDPLLNAFKNKSNGGFLPNTGMGPNLPQQMPNGFNHNIGPNNAINLNHFNQGGMENNAPFPQNQINKNSPKGFPMPAQSPPQSFNFKQKENSSSQNPPQAGAPNCDNAQLLNELMQMKNQLNQMMATMKQKDEIISSQQMKLSQMGLNNNLPNNGMMNMNPYNTNQLNNASNGFLNETPPSNTGNNNNNQLNNASNGFLNDPSSPTNMQNLNQNFYGKFPIPQN